MINEKLQQKNAKLHFLESFQNVENPDRRPFFLYHLPRSGGLTFFNVLHGAFLHAYDAKKEQLVVRPPLCRRIDEDLDPKGDVFKRSILMLCGHVPFGYHKDIGTDFQLLTFIRDPFERILSEYTRDCMRANVEPSLDTFKLYYRQEEHVNFMNRQLHPEAYLTKMKKSDVGATIENLQNNFSVFGTVEHIIPMIQYFLSIYGFPNVLFENLNQTQKRYHLDALSCKDEIMELNQADYELHSYVQFCPRIPKLNLQSTIVKDFSILIYEHEKQKNAIQTMVEISRAELGKFLDIYHDEKMFTMDSIFLNLRKIKEEA